MGLVDSMQMIHAYAYTLPIYVYVVCEELSRYFFLMCKADAIHQPSHSMVILHIAGLYNTSFFIILLNRLAKCPPPPHIFIIL